MNQELVKYGTYIGALMIIVSFILYLVNISSQAISQNIIYIIMALGLVMSLKYYRDNQLDGFMSFGKVFSSGISITFFFSILFAVYQYIMFKVDPNMINQIMEEAIQEFTNRVIKGEFVICIDKVE